MKHFDLQDNIHTGEGDDINLVCLVRGRPSPRVVWTKNSRRLPYDSTVSAIDGAHRHVITIKSITVDDFGLYSCIANNTQRSATGTIVVTGECFYYC